MKTGPLYPKIYNCPKKIVPLQGGTSSAKTVTALQVIATKCIEHKRITASVIAQDVPALKKGAMRDFEKFVVTDEEISRHIADYNKSDRIYYFHNKSLIEFSSYQDEQDARHGKRQILFANEVNAISYGIWWQQNLRTNSYGTTCPPLSILDYNPSNAFWVHEKLLNPNDKEWAGKCQLYITDHRHNPFLSEEEHASIENISDPDMWLVYARGKTGKLKGLIFGHFHKIERLPDVADRIFYGIDYGYTNDPTAIVKVAAIGRKRFAQELSYSPGISAEEIKNILLNSGWQNGQEIYSEADPNMVNQLRVLGLPVQPAIKGPGSVAAGISKVREHECFYTSDSVNFEKEILTYKWITAQDLITGREVMTNQPIDAWNHCCDAFRMADYTDGFRRTN